MKKLLALVAVGAALSFNAVAQTAAPTAAAPAAAKPMAPAMVDKSASMDKAPTKQQNKMGMCNKDAEGKKGDERKAFMKTCLSAGKMSQQDKMKTCNADAKSKDMKGDDRKAFMKTCLSNKPA